MKMKNMVMPVMERPKRSRKDFAAAVKDIKLAILQSRARAAHASQTSIIPVIEGVRRELANGLKERTESRSRRK